jgi:GNAT superfamily N-acetyltransferase
MLLSWRTGVTEKLRVDIGLLKESELDEADRIMRTAFGTFVGLPEPGSFAGDRHFVKSRWGGRHVKWLAARNDGKLIGSNALTRWGTFGFFGPLTVLPEYWDRGVAQQLMDATVKQFDKWRVKRTGLFTFPHSAKHLGLYGRFGYWPQYLTALMTRTPAANEAAPDPVLLSEMGKAEQKTAVKDCARMTAQIEKGLDLTDEIASVLARRLGDVVLVYSRRKLDAFAICHHGAGSQGGTKACYVGFAAARPGKGVGERFEALLSACEAFALSRGVPIEAGVNLARRDAAERMRRRGFKAVTHGVAMMRPHAEGFNRPDAYVLDDLR